MLFTSAHFLLFLLILFALYQCTPQKLRWAALLLGSMVFYAFAGPIFLLYICTTIIVTYICTMGMRRVWEKSAQRSDFTEDKQLRKQYKAEAKAISKRWLVSALVIVLGLLAMVKYTDFVIGNTNVVLGWLGVDRSFGFMRFALPMGISFYTFQTVGYLLDVHRQKAQPLANPLKLALFVSFFPQVVQGPISRFGMLSETLYSGESLQKHNLSRGGMRVLIGFFKKLVIADRLWPALVVLTSYPEDFRGAFYLFSIFMYAVILFMDFTGGIDITIGVAEMFGVKMPENFNRPFYSRSIQEYWTRWHITMYTWFRDYLFYPMTLSKGMLRATKFCRRVLGDGLGKRIPVHLSLLWVWFLTGLWHGATWNFIAWGLANGIVIMLAQELTPLKNRFHARFTTIKHNYLFICAQIFWTFWLMNMIRSFDIYAGVRNTFGMMASVVTDFGLSDFLARGVSELTLYTSDYIAALTGVAVILWISYLGRDGVDFRDKLTQNFHWVARYAVIGIILFMTLVLGAYGHGYDARQFIYNQF
ncbi:MAG: MBOAT family protein [Defluviitaleaceae bacterium]|nr:MBOAT family protein [Defluviitaleaceae bacterium]MCL2274140.1 MBOAT family protein [Defluviitaleaceae bacterium]